MVLSTCVLCCSSVLKHAPKKIKRKFIDSLRLHIKAGPGGMGYQKCGGTGGAGGNVYALGKEGVTLKDIIQKYPNKRIKAGSGENSHSKCIIGPPGSDIIVETPIGVTIFNEAGKKLGEINKDGEQLLVARGGLGGSKETGYSGLKGDTGIFSFDLKLIADVGLVGFPNAGKSTLLSMISNATPRIASYPFTTMHPQIGIISFSDLRKISVADLPGLIEGAHVNLGLGHKFLKHIERTKLLVFVVDVGGFRLGPLYKPRSCLETIVLLNKELEMYREELLDYPAILIINKMDKPGAVNIFKETSEAVNQLRDVFLEIPEKFRPLRPLHFEKIIGLSAINKDENDIEEIKITIREIIDREIESEIKEKEKNLLQKIENTYKEHGPIVL